MRGSCFPGSGDSFQAELEIQEANLAACRRAAAEGYEVLKRGARIAAGSFCRLLAYYGLYCTHFGKIKI